MKLLKDSKILVTGGAGYLGSHCILKLLQSGYKNIISVDNFSNSTPQALQKIESHTGFKIENIKIDLKNVNDVKSLFDENPDIKTIIHFAAVKDPFESLNQSHLYYENNVVGLINLLKFSALSDVSNFIFSSTCAIYGTAKTIPVKENHTINPQNPYASSKWMCENILKDFAKNKNIKIISLRYFNPIGSNSTVGLKEYYTEKSNNIIPHILRVLKNEQKYLNIYGNILPTKDGSGVRDYIHVEDLVMAHIVAMEFLEKEKGSSYYDYFNLGSGNGVSVFELINEFNKLLNTKIPMKILEKRPNEVAEIYSDSTKVNDILKWKAEKTLHQMVYDTLKANNLIP